MSAENLLRQSPITTLQVLAQAYGTSGYSSNNYNGSLVTEPTPVTQPAAPTTSSTLFAPSTGFFAEPPIVTAPLLLVAALVVGTLSFAVTRTIRRRRNKRP